MTAPRVYDAPRLRSRSLASEPLSKEDWHDVYVLYVGFQTAIEGIVRRARRRVASEPRTEAAE